MNNLSFYIEQFIVALMIFAAGAFFALIARNAEGAAFGSIVLLFFPLLTFFILSDLANMENDPCCV